MLTPLDETLLHQTPTTFDHAVTSDHRFFDRWAVGIQHGAASVIYGLANYKNTDTCDGFFCVQVGDRQLNVRLSRPLRPDWSMSVGPLSVEVIEPLVSHRVRLAAHGGSGVEADLVWTGVVPAREEFPHFTRRDARVLMDYSRLDQLGRASGWVSVDGERIEIGDAFAWRDHSWGVRPGMGGPDPGSARRSPGGVAAGAAAVGEPSPALGSLFVWMAFRAGPVTGQFQSRVAADGRVEHVDGHVMPDLANPSSVLDVVSLDHRIGFVDGHTALSDADLEVATADGSRWRFSCRPLRPPWAFCGAGYSGGWADGAGLGVPRSIAVEHDVYTLVGPADVSMPGGTVAQPWHREHDVSIELSPPGAGPAGPIAGDGHLTVIARPPVPGPTLGPGPAQG